MRPNTRLRVLTVSALAVLGLAATTWSVQAASGASTADTYIPLGVASTDGKSSAAWFLDVARQRVVYCTTAGSLSGAPRCETGPLPK